MKGRSAQNGSAVNTLGRRVAIGLCAISLVACEHSTAVKLTPDFGTATPTAEGIDSAALATLVDRSTQQLSDAVIIIRDDKVVYENYFGKPQAPIFGASVSKSFVSLAYGYLLNDGKLSSLDEKVVKYLPNFAATDPAKAQITIRMLMSQTAGLKPDIPGNQNLETFFNTVPTVFTPGTAWQYSNDGADLAGDLIAHIAGEPIDTYLQRKLFTPLGITTAYWNHDFSGLTYTAGSIGGLNIQPIDLAKVGQTILDGGKWHGKQVIPAGYIQLAQMQSQSYEATYGLYWWRLQMAVAVQMTDELLAQWAGNGISPTIVAKLRPLVGTTYALLDDYRAAARALLTTDEVAAINAAFAIGFNHVDPWRLVFDPKVLGIYFDGYNGQYMLIVPDKHLVAVRMRQFTTADQMSAVELNANPTFLSDAYNLVPSAVASVATNRIARGFRF